MSIKRARWANHPSLGNLEQDFTNEKDQPYRTVVIAGENGTGKKPVKLK